MEKDKATIKNFTANERKTYNAMLKEHSSLLGISIEECMSLSLKDKEKLVSELNNQSILLKNQIRKLQNEINDEKKADYKKFIGKTYCVKNKLSYKYYSKILDVAISPEDRNSYLSADVTSNFIIARIYPDFFNSPDEELVKQLSFVDSILEPDNYGIEISSVSCEGTLSFIKRGISLSSIEEIPSTLFEEKLKECFNGYYKIFHLLD